MEDAMIFFFVSMILYVQQKINESHKYVHFYFHGTIMNFTNREVLL